MLLMHLKLHASLVCALPIICNSKFVTVFRKTNRSARKSIIAFSKFLLLIHLRLTEVLHKLTVCLLKFCPNRRFIQASFAWATILPKIDQMTSCMCYLHVNNFISRDFSSCQLLPCTCSASRVKRFVLVV